MKPTETLEVLGDFRAKMTQPTFRDLLSQQVGDVVTKQGWGDGKEKIADRAIDFIGKESKNLVPYFVKEEMTNLVVHASKALNNEDCFDVELLPSKNGLVEFEKPLEILDIRGNTLLVHYLIWATDGDSISILAFNDQYKSPDNIAKAIKMEYENESWWDKYCKYTGRWGYIGIMRLKTGDVIGGESVEYPDYVKNTYLEKFGVEIKNSTNTVRLFHSYILLMAQTIVAVSKERAEKRDAKRLERAKLPSEITVVQFRKTKYTGAVNKESGKEIDWSHRWLVGGHWRWQPYKEFSKKRIWIAPYVKGPDDKPLIMKDKVYVLSK